MAKQHSFTVCTVMIAKRYQSNFLSLYSAGAGCQISGLVVCYQLIKLACKSALLKSSIMMIFLRLYIRVHVTCCQASPYSCHFFSVLYTLFLVLLLLFSFLLVLFPRSLRRQIPLYFFLNLACAEIFCIAETCSSCQVISKVFSK